MLKYKWLLIFILGCRQQDDLWSEAQHACDQDEDRCDLKLTEHFGLDLADDEIRALALDALNILLYWDIGNNCPEWTSTGENGAQCVYNQLAHDYDSIILDSESPHSWSSKGTFYLTHKSVHHDTINITLDMIDPAYGQCASVVIGEGGLEVCEDSDDTAPDNLCTYFYLIKNVHSRTCRE